MKKTFALFWTLILFLTAFAVSDARDIFEAVRKGDLEGVRTLVTANSRLLQEKDPEGKTALRGAVEYAQPSIARFLLDQGAAVDARDAKSMTPLYAAVSVGADREMVDLLLEKGADVNAKDILGTSVLVEAAKINPAIVGRLLDKGAFFPPAGSESLKALVMNASKNGLVDVLDRLMESGADLFQSDQKGETALHKAAAGGNAEILLRLIKAGLPTTAKNLYGWTPLHFAADRGRREAVAVLLDHKADINARTTDGFSPYNLAVGSGRSDVAADLLAKGADRSAPAFPEIRGPYFGQAAPGPVARQFAVGLVSAGYLHHGIPTFTPDGREAYWAVNDFGPKKQRVILESRIENGRWTLPRLASFSKPGFEDDVPLISPDGRKLYFISIRSLEKGGRADKENIWVMKRNGGGWSEPAPLPPIINSIPNIHHQISVDNDGTLYFSALAAEGYGSLDIYAAERIDDTYRKPENLGPAINGSDVEYTPYISPDGTYLMFSRYNPRGWSLLISFREKDGTWGKPRDIGDTVRGGAEMNLDCPGVTRDGKVLFFAGSFDGLIEYNEKPFWIEAALILRR